MLGTKIWQPVQSGDSLQAWPQPRPFATVALWTLRAGPTGAIQTRIGTVPCHTSKLHASHRATASFPVGCEDRQCPTNRTAEWHLVNEQQLSRHGEAARKNRASPRRTRGTLLRYTR